MGDDYVERLEKAVLRTWQYDSYLCQLCGASRFVDGKDISQWHRDRCIVPALEKKWEGRNIDV